MNGKEKWKTKSIKNIQYQSLHKIKKTLHLSKFVNLICHYLLAVKKVYFTSMEYDHCIYLIIFHNTY